MMSGTITHNSAGRKLDPGGIWRAASAMALALLLTFGGGQSVSAEGPVTRIIDAEAAVLQQGRASQGRIDAMAEETDQLVHEYRDMERHHEQVTIYNDHLSQMIASQVSELASLERQIGRIEVTQREIVPLMLRMLAALEGFVAADIPFLVEERSARLAGLRALMHRADVDLPEKFRQLMLAYQTEADYGRSIEAYQGELLLDGHSRSVEFLRLGRLVLAYQTLDRRESGFWDAHRRQWTALAADYNLSVRQGIRMAQRQAAPDLIQVPVFVAEVLP
ncbi:DUF3450 domain-containing protein [Desulfatitalea alkaliphila]|uniref:DUF3450 domain-containing protein n=1 Tax=Desulfatitalea alkaliphila TaxID=2929485 RepID=A0AA41UNS5_9BACT|nr:DUF3450 domain-containing protein [Desulfatitalea alkaliphila]MCJ8499783.1 DUF3450 domain-containing protein [Desulfatitalea alkaliphila]